MAIRIKTVLTDDKTEMECFITTEEKVLINIKEISEYEGEGRSIRLDKDDVNQLIQMLTDLEKEM